MIGRRSESEGRLYSRFCDGLTPAKAPLGCDLVRVNPHGFGSGSGFGPGRVHSTSNLTRTRLLNGLWV
jgi:hypothetical protein